MKKKIAIALGLLIVAILCIALIVLFPVYRTLTENAVDEFDANLTLFMGYGGNCGILRSNRPDGDVLIIDTKYLRPAKDLLRLLQEKGLDKRPITIINTHYHHDHTAGNVLFPKAKVLTGNLSPETWKLQTGLQKLPDECIQGSKELMIGNEKVTIVNMGSAHSESDMVVYLHKRKLLFSGDLVLNGWHPFLSKEYHSSSAGWIAILDRLMKEFDAEVVVPGHGDIASRDSIVRMREYLVSIRDALDNEKELKRLREKYSLYFGLPMLSSVDDTVKFMRGERGGK